MIMMDCTMLLFSLSMRSRSSKLSLKYHVWHKNQNPTIDRLVMGMFLGPKMTLYSHPRVGNVGWGARVLHHSDRLSRLVYPKKWGNTSRFSTSLLTGSGYTYLWRISINMVIGESAVGKSSLVLRFVKGQFHEFQEVSINRIAIVIVYIHICTYTLF